MPKQFLLGIFALCVFSGCGTFDLSLSTPERDFDPNRHALYVMGDECGLRSTDDVLMPGNKSVPFRLGCSANPDIPSSAADIIWTRVNTLWWFEPPKENRRTETYKRLAEWEASCQGMKNRALAEIPLGSTVDLYGHSRGATVVLHCAPELAQMGYQIGKVVLIDGGDMTASMNNTFTDHCPANRQAKCQAYLELVRQDDPYHNGRFDETAALAEQVLVFHALWGEDHHQPLTESFRDDPRVTFATLRGTHGGIIKEAVQYVADLIPPYSETQQ